MYTSVGDCARGVCWRMPARSAATSEWLWWWHGVYRGCSALYSRTQLRRRSIWIEERKGRIQALDIKNGFDILDPQLEPIWDWVDKARQNEVGKVLIPASEYLGVQPSPQVHEFCYGLVANGCGIEDRVYDSISLVNAYTLLCGHGAQHAVAVQPRWLGDQGTCPRRRH